MLTEAVPFTRIYIATGFTDLRAGIDGLAALVKQKFELDPFQAGTLFLFCGRRRDRFKGLSFYSPACFQIDNLAFQLLFIIPCFPNYFHLLI